MPLISLSIIDVHGCTSGLLYPWSTYKILFAVYMK